jgi:hypothetical protein
MKNELEKLPRELSRYTNIVAFSKKNPTLVPTIKTHQVLLSIRSGAGYRGQLLSNRLITA